MTTAPRTLTLTLTIPEQALLDILTGAVEGGCAYWLAADRVKRDTDLNVLSIDNPIDVETGQPFEDDHFICPITTTITTSTVLAGLQRLAEGALPGRADLIGQVALIPSDGHDFDASDYDVIIQLGFFGQLVFA